MVTMAEGQTPPENWNRFVGDGSEFKPISDTWFYYDGSNVVGPHTEREIQELHHSGKLKADSQLCTANDHTWRLLKDFPHLLKKPEKVERPFIETTQTPPDNARKQPTGGVVVQEEDDDEEEDEERLTPIKSIRALLNDLWEAQRESIISKIKNEELPEKHERKRKEHTEIKQSVEELVLEYWRKSKVLDAWIRDLIWEGEDEKGDYRKNTCKGKAIHSPAHFEAQPQGSKVAKQRKGRQII